MMAGLAQAKQRELWRAIHALGIPNVGMQTAKDLARHLSRSTRSRRPVRGPAPNQDRQERRASRTKPSSRESGVEVSESILSFFSDPNHRDWVRAMREAG
ncbi:DNA ligase [Verrucomicrobiota bacterium]|nr:DNA ligase [Verrucomicrobiota bacterium]